MFSKIAIAATTVGLTFGIALPAYAQNDNIPDGSYVVAAEDNAAGAKTMDSKPSADTDGVKETQPADGQTENEEEGSEGPGKTMDSDPK